VKAASSDPLRAQLERLLDWEEAHVGFDKAVLGIPVDQRGARAAGFPHSPWQLLEHLRLAQKDLLDFCLNARYEHALAWPDDYWPQRPAPPGLKAWDETHLRAILLVADHNAYHVGQLVAVRQALDCWP